MINIDQLFDGWGTLSSSLAPYFNRKYEYLKLLSSLTTG